MLPLSEYPEMAAELIAHADVGTRVVSIPPDAYSWTCRDDMYRWASTTVYWQLRATNPICARRWMQGYVSYQSGMPQVSWLSTMQPHASYMNEPRVLTCTAGKQQ